MKTKIWTRVLDSLIEGKNRAQLKFGLILNAWSTVICAILIVFTAKFEAFDISAVALTVCLGISFIGLYFAYTSVRVPAIRRAFLAFMISSVILYALTILGVVDLSFALEDESILPFNIYLVWGIVSIPLFIMNYFMARRLKLLTDLGGTGLLKAGYAILFITMIAFVCGYFILQAKDVDLFDGDVFSGNLQLRLLLCLFLLTGNVINLVGWFLMAYKNPAKIQVYHLIAGDVTSNEIPENPDQPSED